MVETSAEFLCVRCARHMKTCCQTCEIYTTRGDLERIAAHTGLTGFSEHRAPARSRPMPTKTTIRSGETTFSAETEHDVC